MDYSLLVGVVRRHFEVVPREMESEEEIMKLTASSPANDPTLAQRRRTISERPDPFQMDDSGGMHAESVEAPGTYYLGIIDTLQEWNWSKEFERYYKLYVLGQDGAGISAIEPKRYQERFMKRVVNDIFEGLGESSRAVSQITDTQSICILSTTPRNSEAARDDSILY